MKAHRLERSEVTVLGQSRSDFSAYEWIRFFVFDRPVDPSISNDSRRGAGDVPPFGREWQVTILWESCPVGLGAGISRKI